MKVRVVLVVGPLFVQQQTCKPLQMQSHANESGLVAIVPVPVCGGERLLLSCSCSLGALPFDVAQSAKWQVFQCF